MSEEILKALTQLFAIITKQDEGVTDIERSFVITFFQERLNKECVKEYLDLYEGFLVEKKKRIRKTETGVSKERSRKRSQLTSMKDSVRTLAICKKINKTLTQKQKVIVLLELLELVNSDQNFSPQRKEILNTVSTVFNISKSDYDSAEQFVINNNLVNLNSKEIIYASHINDASDKRNLHSEMMNGHLFFLNIKSVDLYFLKYNGSDEISLNGQMLKANSIYLFSQGSTLKPAKDVTIYYSDVVSHYSRDEVQTPISFNCKNLEFKFPNGHIGLQDVNISENEGKLMGIMGASGAGKTTLLNVLAGIESPSNGEVLINGINIHKEQEEVKGVIGYIAQDDVLLEELTVFENLYFNAKLCFNNLSENDIKEKVLDTLTSLGLNHIQDLKVGNILNKKISGGQRKRLNIALELIREPAILFVDEPTSGLSSKDSENVIDLLKELSLKGKLIFIVIHQPSSDIYKMFDTMIIMDTGGYQIFYGNPVEAIVHFKKASNQINSERGQCNDCGNVNPELLFEIVEARVVNEYGQLTANRKVSPYEWNDLFKKEIRTAKFKDEATKPPNSLRIPPLVKQWFIYTSRDLKTKVSNLQYLIINLGQAPLLAAILALILRYKNAENDTAYFFRHNENYPAFILISIVIALFMGLTVSAEEILKDRKILRREQFLDLSKSSYLLSKIGILFTLSLIQTLSFSLLGSYFLGIYETTFSFWLILFTCSCFANILGLNISASFNSAITVYILIPLLLIPQMVLSGALFSFDKLNENISHKQYTPIIADLMASRWAFEAIAVEQYKNNAYEKHLYNLDQKISLNSFYPTYVVPELTNILMTCKTDLKSNGILNDKNRTDLLMLKRELTKHLLLTKNKTINVNELNKKEYNLSNHNQFFTTINQIKKAYNEEANSYKFKRENKIRAMNAQLMNKGKNITDLKNLHQNESLEDIVKNINATHRITKSDIGLFQVIDPVFHIDIKKNNFNYRNHFFAPKKYIFGQAFDTFQFNITVLWLMIFLLYLSLYFDVFKKIIDIFNRSNN